MSTCSVSEYSHLKMAGNQRSYLKAKCIFFATEWRCAISVIRKLIQKLQFSQTFDHKRLFVLGRVSKASRTRWVHQLRCHLMDSNVYIFKLLLQHLLSDSNITCFVFTYLD